MIRRKFQEAYALISSAIEDGLFDHLRRLPSNDALARMAGVSRFTTWQVIEALKKEGRVVGARGHCCRLPAARTEETAVPPQASPPVRRTKGREVIMGIRRDIFNGHYSHEVPLPSAKELTVRYGVCRPTLRKALLTLARESMLEHRGTSFFPMPISAPASQPASRIVLLGFGTNITNTITWGYWHQEYLKQLEMECAKANIALDVMCFARDAGGLLVYREGRSNTFTSFTKNPDVLGYVYEVIGSDSMDDELLQTIAVRGKPVAVLDEMGTWPLPRFLKQHPNVRVFRNTVSDRPAEIVARFVLELGHRTAVFISPHHQWEYSQRRLSGLQRAFSAIEGAHLIAVVSREGENYVAQGTARVRHDDIMASYADWKKEMPHEYTYVLDNHFALLPALCGTGRLHEDLERLLTRALGVRGATAWIMVNDACAHYALDFLERQSIRVPGETSVISFDDQPEALTWGITSYNFNQAATMLAMLRYITDPRLFPARKPVIEIEGKIIPRRTTGKVRAGAESGRL